MLAKRREEHSRQGMMVERLKEEIHAREGDIQTREALLSKNKEERIQQEILQSQITSSEEQIEQLKKTVQEKESFLLEFENVKASSHRAVNGHFSLSL